MTPLEKRRTREERRARYKKQKLLHETRKRELLQEQRPALDKDWSFAYVDQFEVLPRIG